jgi:hypothetical protein
MKKILLAVAVSMLSGCAIIDAYLMTKYDPNEYKLISEIRVDASFYKNECNNLLMSPTNAIAIAHKTELFMVYSEHIPRNKDLISASKQLNDIAKGIADQYSKSDKVSPVFCKIKFDTIEKSAEKIQTVIGGRPR